MCGIAGIHRLTPRPIPKVDQLASELLYGIEQRGTDATGYVAIDDTGGVQLQKASCAAQYFNPNRARIAPDARTVLLHTRWATQGKPAFPENNHPVEAGGIYAVHNGHIYNDDFIFGEAPMPRRGRVDSEAIPALVATRGWESAPDCLGELEGDLAVALVDASRPGELILARGNHSPLLYVRGDHFIVWASTREAIMDAWRSAIGTPPSANRVHYMLEGEALIVRGSALQTVKWAPGRSWTTATINSQWFRSSTPTLCTLPSAVGVKDPKDDSPLYWKCDDCGDWYPEDELIETPDPLNMLCLSCFRWAEESGLVASLNIRH